MLTIGLLCIVGIVQMTCQKFFPLLIFCSVHSYILQYYQYTHIIPGCRYCHRKQFTLGSKSETPPPKRQHVDFTSLQLTSLCFVLKLPNQHHDTVSWGYTKMLGFTPLKTSTMKRNSPSVEFSSACKISILSLSHSVNFNFLEHITHFFYSFIQCGIMFQGGQHK